MTQEELNKLLELHKKWLNNEPNGKQLVLENVDLHGSNLSSAKLRYASLRCANLRDANLRNADLYYVDLRGADLSHADLSHADLRYADLCEANLCYVSLRHADLYRTDLRYTNLCYVDLCGAKLDSAQLNNSNLANTILDNTERYRLGMILKKPMTAWKKCRNNKVVKLMIPKGSIVFCVNGKKYRSNKAKVISVNDSSKETAVSFNDGKFVYVPGERLEIDDFDLRNTVECSTGIHFFRTRKEAEEY